LFIRLGNRKGPHPQECVISSVTATDETMLNSSLPVPGSYVENVIVKDLIFDSKAPEPVEANAPSPKK